MRSPVSIPLAVAFVLGAIGLAPAAAHAGCEDDCSKQYESAMNACQKSNPDPASTDAVQPCMDQAQEAYGVCVDQCADVENDED